MNMVRNYFGQPPIGKAQISYLYDKEGQPKGIDSQIDYKTRNKKANLKNIEAPPSKLWIAADMARLVDTHGPIEALIQLENGWQHNIVVTGVSKDGDNVIYHDPAVGPSQSMPIGKFNDAFCWEYHRSALTAYNG